MTSEFKQDEGDLNSPVLDTVIRQKDETQQSSDDNSASNLVFPPDQHINQGVESDFDENESQEINENRIVAYQQESSNSSPQLVRNLMPL